MTLTIAEFYAPAHRGGAFGILPNSKYYGPSGHRGYDINGWDAGTQIPAFRAGVVVGNYYTSGLGNVLVTRDAIGEWFGYSHLDERSPLDIGHRVSVGDPVGPLGQTGSLADGDHVHLTVSATSSRPESGTTKDPFPYIAAALGSSVSSNDLGDIDMPLDNNDKAWLNTFGQSIIDQIGANVGGRVWDAEIAKGDIHGPARNWLVNTSDSVAAILAKPSAVTDVTKLAAELTKAGLTVNIDEAAIIKALDASRRDDLAAVLAAAQAAIAK